jgi:hypothetical protein
MVRNEYTESPSLVADNGTTTWQQRVLMAEAYRVHLIRMTQDEETRKEAKKQKHVAHGS